MSAGAILGTLGVVAVVVLAGILIDRRWSILPRPGELAQVDPKPPPPDPPGTVASAPLRLTPSKLEHALRAQRCAACRAAVAAGPGEPIRYADHALQLHRLSCAACGATRGLYVDVIAG